MPEVSRFHGIVIRMFFREHVPPHFHAEYSGHQAELRAAWDRAGRLEAPGKIAPLE